MSSDMLQHLGIHSPLSDLAKRLADVEADSAKRVMRDSHPMLEQVSPSDAYTDGFSDGAAWAAARLVDFGCFDPAPGYTIRHTDGLGWIYEGKRDGRKNGGARRADAVTATWEWDGFDQARPVVPDNSALMAEVTACLRALRASSTDAVACALAQRLVMQIDGK